MVKVDEKIKVDNYLEIKGVFNMLRLHLKYACFFFFSWSLMRCLVLQWIFFVLYASLKVETSHESYSIYFTGNNSPSQKKHTTTLMQSKRGL
jgi:hypothetical protein